MKFPGLDLANKKAIEQVFISKFLFFHILKKLKLADIYDVIIILLKMLISQGSKRLV